jgi:outer membrane protein assembly factor BamB
MKNSPARATGAFTVLILVAAFLTTCQKPPASQPAASAPSAAATETAQAPAAQPAHAPRGRAVITFLSGDVTTKSTADWQTAEIGMELAQSVSLKTGAESLCEVQLGSTAVVRVNEKTTISLDELALEQKSARIGVGMVVGTVICKVNALATNERFQVNTPSGVCGVRGTEFVVNVTAQKQLLLGVQKGEVAILPPWADFQKLRTELKENQDVIAPLEQQVNETARVVTANQQLVVTAATVLAWQKALATVEQKVNALSDRAQKGEQITKDEVAVISTSLEPLEPSLSKPLAASTNLTASTSTVLTQTATMLFRDIPEAAPAPGGSSAAPAAPTPAAPALVAVTVTAQPADAEIYLNGLLAGKGECSGLFTVGEKATFIARLAGYADKSLVVTAEAGQARTYSIVLEKDKGQAAAPAPAAPAPAAPPPEKVTIAVRTTPADAEILLNNRSVGSGSFSQGFNDGENLTFIVRADGYDDKTLSVAVAKGGQADYAVTLDARGLVRRFSLSKKSLVGQVSLSAGKVFGADASGTLYAAGLKGEAGWSLATKNTPNETSGPLLLGSRLYFTGAGEFIIVEPANGSIDYRGDLDSASAHQFGQRVAVVGQVGVFPVTAGVRLFDARTGATTREVAVQGGSMTTPAAWNGKIITVSQEGVVTVIDPSTGDSRPLVTTKAVQPVAVSVQVLDDKGYFADRKGLVVCVDLAAAKVSWQVALAKTSVSVFSDLACGPEGIFAYGKGSLYGLSLARGDSLFAPIPGVSCPPLYRDGRLYYGTDQSALVVADAATGKVLGSLDVKAKVTTRPEWLDGLLYLGTATGEIVVVNPAGVK